MEKDKKDKKKQARDGQKKIPHTFYLYHKSTNLLKLGVWE